MDKKHKQKRAFAGGLILASLFFLFLPFVTPLPAKAIGASPSRISNVTVLRGTVQTQSISITRAPSEGNREVTVNVTKRGEYAHYIDAPESIILLSGQNSVIYTFDVDATDAAVGEYQVILSFLVDPYITAQTDTTSGGMSAGVGFITGVDIPITFTVSGDQVVSYDIQSMGMDDTEVDMPIFLTFNIHNTGNVEWKPEKVELTFTDISDPTHVVTEIVESEDFPVVKPSAESVVAVVQAASILIEGTYEVKAKFYYDGQVVAELASSSLLTVYPTGTLAQSGELLSVSTNKASYERGEKVNASAIFKNTGEVKVSGTLYIDIYKDGSYVDLLLGETLTVDMGDEVIFSKIIETDGPGDYVASTYVKYGNKKTDAIDLAFSVISAGGVSDTLSFVNSAWGLAILIGIIIVIAVIIKITRKKKGTPPIIIPQTNTIPTINQMEAPKEEQKIPPSDVIKEN